MTRPIKCACGRYIKPRGFAEHKKSCPAYQQGLREFVEQMPAPKPTSGVNGLDGGQQHD